MAIVETVLEAAAHCPEPVVIMAEVETAFAQ